MSLEPSNAAAEASEIEGSVHSIVFHNEENGYTIMQVKTAESGNITVLGSLPAVTEGEQIKAKGNWRDDRRFGRQFQAAHILPVAPNSTDGIRRFLASGLIDGIGKAYAKRIVDKFGTETFRVIEEESKKLEKINGIGEVRRIRIKDSWKRQKTVRDIMIFLHEHGLSTARALRLFKTYGEEATNVLRADPYRLAREIPGVGFKTADQIARQMGQADDSPQRINAGLLYVLEEAARQGHCALPRTELIEEAATILDMSSATVNQALKELILGSHLIVEDSKGQSLVFTTELHQAEIEVAAHLQALLKKKGTLPDVNPEQAIAWFERHNQLKLSNEQAETVIQSCRHRFSIITGGPGVGKTTILNAILEILSAKGVEPLLCAPTGRAAKRLHESTGRAALTLHRALEYQPQVGFTRNRQNKLSGDFFVIDETSMVDVVLMASLLDAIPDNGHLLLVGDVDQLPSVGPGSVLQDMIESGVFPVARLTRIFRQSESSRIVKAAHDVNKGEIPSLENTSGTDFFFIEREHPKAIRETLQHLIKERIPHGFDLNARDDIQVLTPMNRQSLGTNELNTLLQETLNPPAELKFEIERFGSTFRTGDKVIQTRNNYEKEVFNGDIGHISDITTEPAQIEVSFEGNHRVSYEPGELDELQLAYAITIHKSQGSEFPVVVIPVAGQQFMLLQQNLLYTGITRGRKLVILVGERRALNMAVRNEKSSRRFTGLSDKLRQLDLDQPN